MQEIQIPKQEFVATSSLKVDGKNPNKMTKEQHERLATSMKKWGWLVDIITNKDLLIADGEQRLIVAKELGMPQVGIRRLPVEEVDRRLLRQVLNKLRGEHELLLDAEEFEQIIDLGRKDDLKYLLDLTDGKLERYLNELHPPAQEDEFEGTELEKVQTDIKQGDIIQLENHRLMCGDSSKDSNSFVKDITVKMVLTDPPYGIDLETDWSDAESKLRFYMEKSCRGRGHNHEKVMNDNKLFDAKKYLAQFAHVPEQFWWGANYYAETIPDRNDGSWFVWDKRVDDTFDRMYGSCFELCWSKQKHKQQVIRVKWAGIFGTETQDTHKRIHPTQKPIEVSSFFIEQYSEPTDIILDLFGGSGSTLIACEQTGRTCYMMEIDPRYCEIIAQRWEKYTGGKRQKLNNQTTDGKSCQAPTPNSEKDMSLGIKD